MTTDNLNPREQAVLDCIPAGHANAISRRQLTRMACLNDRLIREIIYRLVVERGLPIGSSTEPEGGGYFLIEDLEDLEVATRRTWFHILYVLKKAYVANVHVVVGSSCSTWS